MIPTVAFRLFYAFTGAVDKVSTFVVLWLLDWWLGPLDDDCPVRSSPERRDRIVGE